VPSRFPFPVPAAVLYPSLVSDPDDKVRLDKWLWAARFFKTRSLAVAATTGGKVEVNGERAKPAKPVHPGDEVRLRLGPYEHVVLVRGLSERRGPAREAQALYEETAESKAARVRLAEQLRLAPAAFVFEDKGRPTKKDRRQLARFIDRKRGG
jgi:ribosome-associated heat shock protein Hsp15